MKSNDKDNNWSNSSELLSIWIAQLSQRKFISISILNDYLRMFCCFVNWLEAMDASITSVAVWGSGMLLFAFCLSRNSTGSVMEKKGLNSSFRAITAFNNLFRGNIYLTETHSNQLFIMLILRYYGLYLYDYEESLINYKSVTVFVCKLLPYFNALQKQKEEQVLLRRPENYLKIARSLI